VIISSDRDLDLGRKTNVLFTGARPAAYAAIKQDNPSWSCAAGE
jgi:hypothetical protein